VENKTEGNEAAEKMQGMLKRVKPDLTIYRVPEKSLQEFKDFAKEEFADDYGLLLKFLLDNAKVDDRIMLLAQYIDDVALRISALEEKLKIFPAEAEEKEFTTKRMMSGKIVKIPKKE